jgi:hypothetical protein
METPTPNTAGLAAAPSGAAPPTSFASVLGRNIDIAALAVGAIAFFVATSNTPDAACGAGYAEDPSSLFSTLQVLSPLAFVVAALAALACRRHVAAKIAGLLAYGGIAVPVFIGLALAGAPCAFY